MTTPPDEFANQVATATRTLFASGFAITGVNRHPNHIEYECSRPDVFGVEVPYTMVVFESPDPVDVELTAARREAERLGRILVIVARRGGANWLAWEDFLDVMGGPVPTWRALNSNYRPILLESGANKRPAGEATEAWVLFENAAADGLEFITGMRARRLGGARRGQRLSDIIVQTPARDVILVDAKASGDLYDAAWPNLRALVEYTKQQITRQRGAAEVASALVVANDFRQSEEALAATSNEFFAEAHVPVSFLRSDTLIRMVEKMAGLPHLRRVVQWRRVLSAIGVVQLKSLDEELTKVQAVRVSAEAPRR